MSIIILDAKCQNRIIVYPEANNAFDSLQIKHAFQNDYDAVLLQFEIPKNKVIEMCREAYNKNVKVILDAGPAMDFPLEELKG